MQAIVPLTVKGQPKHLRGTWEAEGTSTVLNLVHRAGLKGLPTLLPILKEVIPCYHDVSCFRSHGSFRKFGSSASSSKIVQVDR